MLEDEEFSFAAKGHIVTPKQKYLAVEDSGTKWKRYSMPGNIETAPQSSPRENQNELRDNLQMWLRVKTNTKAYIVPCKCNEKWKRRNKLKMKSQ